MSLCRMGFSLSFLLFLSILLQPDSPFWIGTFVPDSSHYQHGHVQDETGDEGDQQGGGLGQGCSG